MATYYIREGQAQGVLESVAGARTFAPGQTNRLPWVDSTDGAIDASALSRPRPAQSPKGFFLPAAESMGRYGPGVSQDASPAVETESKPLVLIGVRACELRARNYLDKVMLEGEFEDPLYQQRRQETTTISCDCADCTDSCFCTLVGGLPYATEGYDVNLSPIPGGMVVDVVGERGEQWLADNAPGLAEADPEFLARRDEAREKMVRRLKLQNAEFTFTASDETQPALPDDADDAWQAFAADCVECGA